VARLSAEGDRIDQFGWTACRAFLDLGMTLANFADWMNHRRMWAANSCSLVRRPQVKRHPRCKRPRFSDLFREVQRS